MGSPGDLGEWKAEVLKGLRARVGRRDFLRRGVKLLGGAAAAGAALSTLGALSDHEAGAAETAGAGDAATTGVFYFPRLKFEALAKAQDDPNPDAWDVYPDADANLRRQVRRLTNINMSEEPVVCSLDDLDGMVKYPFIFATDERHFRFSKQHEDNLAEYLRRGGFLYGDDCVLRDQSLFFRDFRVMMNRIWPDNPMRRVPDDHELYHCYFDFPRGLPYLQGEHEGAWATFDRKSGRILTLVTPTDLHCGWTCRFFTPEQNMDALKMGINIIVYYLSH